MSRQATPWHLANLLIVLVLLAFARVGWAVPTATLANGIPPVLFSAHGTFKGKSFLQNNQTFFHQELRTAPLSLPAGQYWFFADYHCGSQVSTASMQLLGADETRLPEAALSGFTSDRAGRMAQKITLAAPFTGTLQFGGGAPGPAELWFRIVSAGSSDFLPFGFGAVPKPLKKGAANAVRGTLSDDIGDFYYFSLPAGSWQVSLIGTIDVGNSASTPPKPTNRLGANVELLNEQGAPKILTDSNGSSSAIRLGQIQFDNSGQERAESRQVFRAETGGYVKLCVERFSGEAEGQVIPLHYVLTLAPATTGTPPKP